WSSGGGDGDGTGCSRPPSRLAGGDTSDGASRRRFFGGGCSIAPLPSSKPVWIHFPQSSRLSCFSFSSSFSGNSHWTCFTGRFRCLVGGLGATGGSHWIWTGGSFCPMLLVPGVDAGGGGGGGTADPGRKA
ncbi:hypothetical protein Vretifemale_12115, partial [Volvox reticuliferus]